MPHCARELSRTLKDQIPVKVRFLLPTASYYKKTRIQFNLTSID